MGEQGERLRIVHVTTVPETLWAFFGGLIGSLLARGYEVHAVSSPGPALDAFGDRESIPVHPLPMERGIHPARDLVTLARLVRLFRRLRPRIVHVHTPKAGLLGIVAARIAGVPIRLYHLHGLRLETCRGWRRRTLRLCERVACRSATRVLAVGSSVRERAVAEGLAPGSRIAVPGTGSFGGVDARGRFDPASFSAESRTRLRVRLGLPPDAVVLGFVGRLARDKGLGELAAAWRAVRQDDDRLRLLIVGPDDPSDPPAGEVLVDLAADPRVILAGEQRDLPPLYATMDIVLLPTFREGFPLVPLEAAAMGLPVIGTTATGCRDAVVDGTTGLLVPPGDDAGLARAIRIYLGDPVRRTHDGLAGRDWVLDRFRPELSWDALHAEYARLVAEDESESRRRAGRAA